MFPLVCFPLEKEALCWSFVLLIIDFNKQKNQQDVAPVGFNFII
jgi:hypothetical protein